MKIKPKVVGEVAAVQPVTQTAGTSSVDPLAAPDAGRAYLAGSRPFTSASKPAMLRVMEAPSMRLQVENDLALVHPTVEKLITPFLEKLGEDGVFGLRLALEELLINAIEHGNLGITYQEKSDAMNDSRLAALLAERRDEPGRKDRRVTIEVFREAEVARFVITDQGAGFDVSKLPDPTAGAGLEELHGRGIMVARGMNDGVAYNDKGNQVTLTKKLG